MFYLAEDKLINIGSISHIRVRKNIVTFNMNDHETIEVVFDSVREARKEFKRLVEVLEPLRFRKKGN